MERKGLVVREAQVGDHTIFVRLHPELGISEPPANAEAFAALLPHVLIAELDGVPAGFVRFLPQIPVGWIGALVTDPAMRRRGVGAALLEEAAKRMSTAGSTRWRLSVKVDNGPAISLYERFGFIRGARAQVFRVPRSSLAPLAVGAEYRAATISEQEAPALETRFRLPGGSLSRGTTLSLSHPATNAVRAVARVMPEVPSARYFAVDSLEDAPSLLAAVNRLVGAVGTELLVVTEQPALADWLVTLGARIYLDTLNMEGPLPG